MLKETAVQARRRFPSRVSINITRRCNLRCDHCLSSSGHADTNELTTAELLDLIDQLSCAGKPTLAIGGGEPLTRRDLFTILAHAQHRGVTISLVTNGTFVNDRVAKRLNDFGLVSITVSLDGLKQNHERIRGVGNFDKGIRAITTLRTLVETTKLCIRVTVNTLNINECPDLIRLAEQLGVDLIRLTPVLPLGRALEHSDLLLSQAEYLRFLADCHAVTTSIKVVLPDDPPNPDTFVPGQIGNHCGREICWITQTGDVFPCIFFGDKYVAGNIRDTSFLELWHRCQEMSQYRSNEYCLNCSILKDCRGGCRCRALSQYGDINAVDPFCPLGKNKEYESTLSSHRHPLYPHR